MSKVSIFHNSLSLNTTDTGGQGGLSISAKGTGGGSSGKLDDFLSGTLNGSIEIKNWSKWYDNNGNEYLGLRPYQFAFQKNLSSITLPDSDEKLYFGESAFRQCENLSEVNISPTNFNIEKLPRSCFEGCTKLETFVVPKNVRIIENNVFKNSGLKNVSLPTPLVIYPGVFYGCKLKELDLSGIHADLMLENLPELEVLKLSSSIDSLLEVSKCPKIKKLVIPSGITCLGNGGRNDKSKVFYGTKIQNGLYLPSTIDTISPYAFENFDGDVYCDFAQYHVAGEPWGGDASRIHYNVPLPTEE